jgi:peptidoglycan hydrolase-like protein with peptidoglycan-binding domain
MRGADVRWLRDSLQHLHGMRTDGPVSDVFDAELSKLVREFQRQHRLTVDGIAGVQTQIALASAVAGPDAPLLYVADTHGS